MPKNVAFVEIDDCLKCPDKVIKTTDYGHKMFCQTKDSCICLRDGCGSRPIPDWCPRLVKKKKNWKERLGV